MRASPASPALLSLVADRRRSLSGIDEEPNMNIDTNNQVFLSIVELFFSLSLSLSSSRLGSVGPARAHHQAGFQ